jgi:Uma2 family endonuclease
MQTRWRLMTDAQYYRFCMTIPDLRIERTAEGDILIMSPGGAETSWRNGELTMQLGNWAQKEGRGRAFDSSVEYDPDHRTAYIYPPDREPEQLVNPERIAGEGPWPVLC